jgi:hypothetical protein
MAEANLAAGTPAEQHEPAPLALENQDLASVDILGEPGTSFERFAGRTLLAEFLFHSLPEKGQKSPLGRAAGEMENETLPGVADTPGFSLRDVEVRLAYVHRLLLWGSEPENGPYGAAATRMVAAALSDVVLMRAAERAKPRLAEVVEPSPEQEPAAAPEATVPVVLQQMTNLLRDMTTLFGEQQEELRRIHGERKEEAAAA